MLTHLRFDLFGSTLEPIIAEPTSIELVIGDNSTQKAEVPDCKPNQSAKEKNKSVSVPASDVPGRHIFVELMDSFVLHQVYTEHY